MHHLLDLYYPLTATATVSRERQQANLKDVSILFSEKSNIVKSNPSKITNGWSIHSSQRQYFELDGAEEELSSVMTTLRASDRDLNYSSSRRTSAGIVSLRMKAPLRHTAGLTHQRFIYFEVKILKKFIDGPKAEGFNIGFSTIRGHQLTAHPGSYLA